MTALELAQPQRTERQRRSAVGIVYGLGVLLYALGALGALALNALFTESIPVVGILKSFLHLILLPALVLLPLNLLLRRWRLAFLLSPVAVGFALLYGAYFVPRAHAAEGDQAVRLLTFNIEDAAHWETQAVVDTIKAADADIVAIQELSVAAAEDLESHLGGEYPYRALYPQDDGRYGQGILSRYPIGYDLYWSIEDGYPPLGYQQAEIDLGGKTIALYNVHPMRPSVSLRSTTFDIHTQAVGSILEWVKEETLPVLIAGDFNMTDQYQTYRDLQAAGFTDSYRAAGDVGFGFTFPQDKRFPMPPFPVLRLDYIFYDSNFGALSAHVWPDAGSSDHHPLLAQIYLRDAVG